MKRMHDMKKLFQKYREMILYMLFGCATTLVNLLVYHLCYDRWGLANDPSVILAWFFSVLTAFATNKPFVFGSHDWSGKVLCREAGEFFGCRLASGLIELVVMHFAVELMELPGTPMKLLVNILVIILNYIGSKLWVFRKNS